MQQTRTGAAPPEPPLAMRRMSTPQLMKRITDDARDLVRDEIALARAELKANIKREMRTAVGFAIAGVFGICMITLFLVSAAFGIGLAIPGWAGALIMAGVAFVVALASAGYGWIVRVKRPMAETRKTVKENVQWARERMH